MRNQHLSWHPPSGAADLAIARAIRDRDPEAASAAMVTHLRTALDRLNAVFAGDARAADGATTRQGR